MSPEKLKGLMILDEFGAMSLELLVGRVKQNIDSELAVHKYSRHVIVTDLSGYEEWIDMRML